MESVFGDGIRTKSGTTHACFSRRGCRRTYRTSSTRTSSNVCNRSRNFSGSSIVDKEVLRDNAALDIISDITGVTLASVIVKLIMSVTSYFRQPQ
jgi:hypothetical protein